MKKEKKKRIQTRELHKERGSCEKAVKNAVFMAFLMFFYVLSLEAYGQLQENQEVLRLVLSAPLPDDAQAKAILESEEEQESSSDLCFYEGLGWQTVENRENKRSVSAETVSYLGDVSLYDRMANGVLPEDPHACVLGGDTAWQLFGSRDVVGKEVVWKDTAYVVRRVLPGSDALFLVRSGEAAVSYHSLVLRRSQMESSSTQIDQFLMRNGISGKRADGRMLRILGFLALSIVPLLFAVKFLYFCADIVLPGRSRSGRIGSSEKKQEVNFSGQRKKTNKRQWAAFAIVPVLLAILILYVGSRISIPREWIPDKWADFSFWGEKYRELTQELLCYLRTAKTTSQTRELLAVGKIWGCSFLSVLCAFSLHIGENRDKNIL